MSIKSLYTAQKELYNQKHEIYKSQREILSQIRKELNKILFEVYGYKNLISIIDISYECDSVKVYYKTHVEPEVLKSVTHTLRNETGNKKLEIAHEISMCCKINEGE